VAKAPKFFGMMVARDGVEPPPSAFSVVYVVVLTTCMTLGGRLSL
jgi:hypothetical protein